jgi:hypothetical protein
MQVGMAKRSFMLTQRSSRDAKKKLAENLLTSARPRDPLPPYALQDNTSSGAARALPTASAAPDPRPLEAAIDPVKSGSRRHGGVSRIGRRSSTRMVNVKSPGRDRSSTRSTGERTRLVRMSQGRSV